jgi:uncharacterized protein with FMN-binding domain
LVVTKMPTHPRPASLARRALPALAVLGASGALLTQLGGSDGVSAQVLTTTATGATATGSLTTTQPPSTTARSGASTTAGAAPTATTPKTAPPTTAASTTAPSTTAPSTGTCTGTTHTGVAETNKYGVVQVAAIISANKKLCDVQVLSYPSNDRKSLAINQRALPTLRTEALAANSATIAGVTGATITSRSYEASLQSALDAAK